MLARILSALFAVGLMIVLALFTLPLRSTQAARTTAATTDLREEPSIQPVIQGHSSVSPQVQPTRTPTRTPPNYGKGSSGTRQPGVAGSGSNSIRWSGGANERELIYLEEAYQFRESCLSASFQAVYTRPLLIDDYTNLYRRSFSPPSYWTGICACGYRPDDLLTVTLRSSITDTPLLTITEKVEQVSSGNGPVLNYCYSDRTISQYAFLPDDSLGQYMVEISSADSLLTHTFELTSPAQPLFYRVGRPEVDYDYVLAGFNPTETVKIVAYAEPRLFELEFAGQLEMTLDETGGGALAGASPDLEFFVIRPDEMTFVPADSIFSPIDYSHIVTDTSATFSDQQRAKAAYQLHRRTLEIDTSLLEMALSLDPSFAPIYYELGLYYEAKGLAQFSEPDELDELMSDLFESDESTSQPLDDFNKANTYYWQAANRDSDYLQATFRRAGLNRNRLNRLNLAIALYTGIVNSTPRPDQYLYYERAHFERAQSYLQRGQPDDELLAAADFRRYLEIGTEAWRRQEAEQWLTHFSDLNQSVIK